MPDIVVDSRDTAVNEVGEAPAFVELKYMLGGVLMVGDNEQLSNKYVPGLMAAWAVKRSRPW